MNASKVKIGSASKWPDGTVTQASHASAVKLPDLASANFDDAVLYALRSYSRVFTAPCTITYEPLGSVRVNSACFPKETIRCQSVRLCQSPAVSFHVSLVATESVKTSVLFCV